MTGNRVPILYRYVYIDLKFDYSTTEKVRKLIVDRYLV